MKYAICYVSTAAQQLSTPGVEHLLSQSQKNNNSNDITGLLLYSKGNFFQILEGQKEDISSLYERITEDNRYYNIIKIFEKKIEGTKFEEYQVDFLSLDAQLDKREISVYFDHIEKLDPKVQSSVKYILNQFMNGI